MLHRNVTKLRLLDERIAEEAARAVSVGRTLRRFSLCRNLKANDVCGTVESGLGVTPLVFLFGQPEGTHQRGSCTATWVWAFDRPRPEPRDDGQFLPDVILQIRPALGHLGGDASLGIQMADP